LSPGLSNQLQASRRSLDCLTVRRTQVRLVGGLAAILVLAASRRASADPTAELEKAHSAYVARHYEEAEAKLRALIASGAIKDPDLVADARMYLGAVLVAEGKQEDAAAVFDQLLNDRPRYDPDQLKVTVQAMYAFIDAKTRNRDKIRASLEAEAAAAEAERIHAEQEKELQAKRLAMLEKLAGEERVVEHHSRWLALIPFGAGQFQNGQTGLGVTFLAAESAFAAGSVIGAIFTIYKEAQTNAARQAGQGNALTYHSRADLAALLGNVSIGACAFTAIVGIAHAQLTFVPERVEIHKRPIPPLSLTPLIGPTGIGLAGTF
jgi:hypothetical protein